MMVWSMVGTQKVPQICPRSSEYTQKESCSGGHFTIIYIATALVYMTEFLRKKDLILSGITGNPDENSLNNVDELHFLLTLFPIL